MNIIDKTEPNLLYPIDIVKYGEIFKENHELYIKIRWKETDSKNVYGVCLRSGSICSFSKSLNVSKVLGDFIVTGYDNEVKN